MASVIMQELIYSSRNFGKLLPVFATKTRKSSVIPKQKGKKGTIKHRNLISSTCQSLADRGFLRSYKPYEPPPDAVEKACGIVQNTLGSSYRMSDRIPKEYKFQILDECFREFKYSVPNSMLHCIVTGSDIAEFYKTPVKTNVPYDDLANSNLPPNLHIIEDYNRFDPETDTMFDGISAYPESPTIVTGLKYKNKYKGTKKKLPFYYDNEAVFSASSTDIELNKSNE